jgi:hypothetical protein
MNPCYHHLVFELHDRRIDMKRLLLLAMLALVTLAGPASALDPYLTGMGPRQDPAVSEHRQGGDHPEDAVAIPSLPFTTSGTTTGMTDDFAESCPYGNSGYAPDVFYVYEPASDVSVFIDLCGSHYDTCVYLVDANTWQTVACNDDYYYDDEECANYTSRIEEAALVGGGRYYVIVDGYPNAHGDYEMLIAEWAQVDVQCPAAAMVEGEPPLHPYYYDSYNGGCDSPMFGEPLQELPAAGVEFCGRSGWYVFDMISRRDTDWLVVPFDAGGSYEVTLVAEVNSYAFELGPQDCANVGVLQHVVSDRGEPASFTVTGAPGAVVWLWVGPTQFERPNWWPDDEYDYVLTIVGTPVQTEPASWGRVKALFR